jgi:hypothetical protein
LPCCLCHGDHDSHLLVHCQRCQHPRHTYCEGLDSTALDQEWHCIGCTAALAAEQAQQRRGRGRPRSEVGVDKRQKLELSVTVGRKGRDIPMHMWHTFSEWLRTKCMAGVAALERGDALDHLHIQVRAQRSMCMLTLPSAAARRARLLALFHIPACAPCSHSRHHLQPWHACHLQPDKPVLHHHHVLLPHARSFAAECSTSGTPGSTHASLPACTTAVHCHHLFQIRTAMQRQLPAALAKRSLHVAVIWSVFWGHSTHGTRPTQRCCVAPSVPLLTLHAAASAVCSPLCPCPPQAVVRIHATCAQAVTSAIKEAVGTSTDLVVASKYLTGQGVHCWKGMLGYVTKQHREDHYQVEKHNVSDAAIEEGQAFYALNAASAGVKGKKPLNPTSLVQVRTMGHWYVRCRVRRCIWVSRDRPPNCRFSCSHTPACLAATMPRVCGRIILHLGACWQPHGSFTCSQSHLHAALFCSRADGRRPCTSAVHCGLSCSPTATLFPPAITVMHVNLV